MRRLLRADNEAVSVTWEVINEDNEQHKPEPVGKPKAEKKKSVKREASDKKPNTSNVVDIFGGALSDSDIEDDNVDMDRMSSYDSRSDTNSMLMGEMHGKRDNYSLEFNSQMFRKKQAGKGKSSFKYGLSSGDDTDYSSRDVNKDDKGVSIDKLRVELEELKQRKHKLQNEIAGMENLALRQRFQETLHTLNQEVMYKEMQYQGLIALQNSEDL